MSYLTLCMALNEELQGNIDKGQDLEIEHPMNTIDIKNQQLSETLRKTNTLRK